MPVIPKTLSVEGKDNNLLKRELVNGYNKESKHLYSSPITIRYSLFVIHYSLFTIHPI